MSMSTPQVGGGGNAADPRDEKLGEMERMVASYQHKLDSVTNSYQVKRELFVVFFCFKRNSVYLRKTKLSKHRLGVIQRARLL